MHQFFNFPNVGEQWNRSVLLQINLDSTGTTYTSLQTFAKVPFEKDLFISLDRGTEIGFSIILRTFVEMLFGAEFLLFFNVLMSVSFKTVPKCIFTNLF